MFLVYNFTYETETNSFDYPGYEYEPTAQEENAGWEEFLTTIDPEDMPDPETCDLRDYFADDFKEFMHDWCEDAAHDAFYDDPTVAADIDDAIEYRRDSYAYYGVSRSDFF